MPGIPRCQTPRSHLLAALALWPAFAACAPAPLGLPQHGGLVVVEVRVNVRCLDSGYSTPVAALLETPWPDDPHRPTASLALSAALLAPRASSRGMLRAGPEQRAGEALLARAGGHGGRGSPYREPPCDDRPSSFASGTNVADRIWIERAGQRLEGRVTRGLLIVPDVPPGEWRVTSLRFNFSFGGLVYVVRLPGPAFKDVALPELSAHVVPGQVAYLGVLSLAATRDVAYRDRLSASYTYDARAEQAALRRLLEIYQGTPWAAPIEARLGSDSK